MLLYTEAQPVAREKREVAHCQDVNITRNRYLCWFLPRQQGAKELSVIDSVMTFFVGREPMQVIVVHLLKICEYYHVFAFFYCAYQSFDSIFHSETLSFYIFYF